MWVKLDRCLDKCIIVVCFLYKTLPYTRVDIQCSYAHQDISVMNAGSHEPLVSTGAESNEAFIASIASTQTDI